MIPTNKKPAKSCKEQPAAEDREKILEFIFENLDWPFINKKACHIHECT
jgi:hypothetical protein